MAKFEVALGEDWELTASFEGDTDDPKQLVGEVKDLVDKVKELKEFHEKGKDGVGRRLLASVIVCSVVIALLIATVWGLYNADFSGLQQVWAAGSVPLGLVVGYYFWKK